MANLKKSLLSKKKNSRIPKKMRSKRNNLKKNLSKKNLNQNTSSVRNQSSRNRRQLKIRGGDDIIVKVKGLRNKSFQDQENPKAVFNVIKQLLKDGQFTKYRSMGKVCICIEGTPVRYKLTQKLEDSKVKQKVSLYHSYKGENEDVTHDPVRCNECAAMDFGGNTNFNMSNSDADGKEEIYTCPVPPQETKSTFQYLGIEGKGDKLAHEWNVKLSTDFSAYNVLGEEAVNNAVENILEKWLAKATNGNDNASSYLEELGKEGREEAFRLKIKNAIKSIFRVFAMGFKISTYTPEFSKGDNAHDRWLIKNSELIEHGNDLTDDRGNKYVIQLAPKKEGEPPPDPDDYTALYFRTDKWVLTSNINEVNKAFDYKSCDQEFPKIWDF